MSVTFLVCDGLGGFVPVSTLKKGSEDEDLTLSEYDWALNNFYELGYLAKHVAHFQYW